MAVIATRSWIELAMVVILVGTSHAFLSQFCGISNEQARQRVIACVRQNLPDDVRTALETRLTALGDSDIEAATTICDEFSKDSNYRLTLEQGQRNEDIRSVERVMASCLAEQVIRSNNK